MAKYEVTFRVGFTVDVGADSPEEAEEMAWATADQVTDHLQLIVDTAGDVVHDETEVVE